MRVLPKISTFTLPQQYSKRVTQRWMSQTNEGATRPDVQNLSPSNSESSEKLKKLTPYLRFGGAILTVVGATYKIIDSINTRFKEERQETNEQFKEVNEKFKEVNERFKEVDKKFDKVYEKIESSSREVEKKFDKVYEKIESSNDALYTRIVHLMLIGRNVQLDHDSLHESKSNNRDK